MHSRHLLIVLFLLVSVMLQGQTEVPSSEYKFRRVSPEGGLEYNGQRDARQDKWGLVWVITVNDLFRFDGYTFKRYTDKFPNPIDNNNGWQLNQIEINAANDLYIATRRGLLKYDSQNDVFECIYTKPVHCMHEDSKERLWLSSHTIGYLDRKTDTFIPIKISLDEKDMVTVINESQEGIFIATQSGQIFRLNESLMEFRPFAVETGRRIIDVIHSHSYMYVLTEAEGLFVINMSNKQILKHYTFFYPDNDRRILARDLHIDRSGKIWISTQRGIYLLDPISDQYSRYQYRRSDLYGLPSSSI